MAYNNNRRDNRREEVQSEFTEKVVTLNRVSQTVKGGRIFKFAALCVVGDGKGRVGFGLGKAGEVSEAIRKGIDDAKKNVVTITLSGSRSLMGNRRVRRGKSPSEAGSGRYRRHRRRTGARLVEADRNKRPSRQKCCDTQSSKWRGATMVGLQSRATRPMVAKTRGKSVEEIQG